MEIPDPLTTLFRNMEQDVPLKFGHFNTLNNRSTSFLMIIGYSGACLERNKPSVYGSWLIEQLHMQQSWKVVQQS